MIIDEVCTLQMLYNDLNRALSIVHKFISHTHSIPQTSIPEIEKSIDTYMITYRRMFPNKVIPKQHFVRKILHPTHKTVQVRTSLLGEKGTENSHQMVAALEHRARGIKNPLNRLKHILSARLLQVGPSLRFSNN